MIYFHRHPSKHLFEFISVSISWSGPELDLDLNWTWTWTEQGQSLKAFLMANQERGEGLTTNKKLRASRENQHEDDVMKVDEVQHEAFCLSLFQLHLTQLLNWRGVCRRAVLPKWHNKEDPSTLTEKIQGVSSSLQLFNCKMRTLTDKVRTSVQKVSHYNNSTFYSSARFNHDNDWWLINWGCVRPSDFQRHPLTPAHSGQ